jgi:S1-C subfamily serine protease
MEHVRRLIFAFAIFLAASLIFSIWRQNRPGYGLLDFLRGEAPPKEQFTPAAAPKLNLDDIPLLTKMNEEFSKLSAAVLPSVVSVNTRTVRRGQVYHPFFGIINGQSQVVPGLGSGAIISKEGHVITNYHVVAGVNEVIITTNDNKKYPARILGAHRERDIALLKIEDKRNDFPALTFANSDLASVGQLVFAVGNPFGLSGTVTQGIISARDRHLSDGVLDYLQTDTVINPGNSGGPLVNIRGEIMGINVAIFRGDENVRAWQGIGLAIPANSAKTIIEALMAQAKGGPALATPGLGYMGLVLSNEIVSIDPSLGGTSRTGAFIADLDPNSPAAQAGLLPGDVITTLNGQTFKDPNDLLRRIRELPPGTTAKVALFRNARPQEVAVVIGQRPTLPQ